jgi:hypothetical protein
MPGARKGPQTFLHHTRVVTLHLMRAVPCLADGLIFAGGSAAAYLRSDSTTTNVRLSLFTASILPSLIALMKVWPLAIMAAACGIVQRMGDNLLIVVYSAFQLADRIGMILASSGSTRPQYSAHASISRLRNSSRFASRA